MIGSQPHYYKPLSSIIITLEKEHQRKIRIQARAQETLRASSAPIQSLSTRGEHQVRSSQRTKTKVLAFLAQSPSFRPKTNAKVPDFDKLHQAFQKEVMERTERREVTLCQPFQLRTSALQPHRSRRSTDKSPVSLVIFLFSIQFWIWCFNVSLKMVNSLDGWFWIYKLASRLLTHFLKFQSKNISVLPIHKLI